MAKITPTYSRTGIEEFDYPSIAAERGICQDPIERRKDWRPLVGGGQFEGNPFKIAWNLTHSEEEKWDM